MFSKAIPLFLLVVYTLTEEDSFTKPCETTDIECLKLSTQQFLKKTVAGIPQYNIKQLDPYTVPALNFKIDDDVIVHFTNATINGARNLELTDFKMDAATKSLIISTKMDVTISGEVSTEFPKRSKTISGSFKGKTVATGSFSYNYSIRTGEKGAQYFEVGPETIQCKTENPKLELSREWHDAVKNDVEINNMKRDYDVSKITNLKEKIWCQILNPLYATVVHNIRAAAKILPKEAFFKNI